MPKLIIKNRTNKEIKRANKSFAPKEERKVFINKYKVAVIDACVGLEWEYADPLMAVDFENIEDYTARELKEYARRAEIKNYSTMLKDDLIEKLEIKKGIKQPNQKVEDVDEVEEDEVEDTEQE